MKNLLIFTFSPVQSFISASRRPRDLFTGSYILSYLTGKVISNLKDKGVNIIYPQSSEDLEGLANYPNKIVALVENCEVECEVKRLFKKTWRGIYLSVLKGTELKKTLKSDVKNQFINQVESYFNIFTLCIPLIDKNEWERRLKVREENEISRDNYGYTYDFAERKLGAKKSWRPYCGQIDDVAYEKENEKKNEAVFPNGCTMCGERLHLAIDWRRDKLKKVFKKENDLRHIREGEKLCAVCITKRFAVKYYFKERGILKEDYWHFPSTEEIAGLWFKKALAHRIKNDQNKNDLLKEFKKLREEMKLKSDKDEDIAPYILRKKPLGVEEIEHYLDVDAEVFRKDGWEGLFRDMKTILGDEKAENAKKIIVSLTSKIKEKENYNLEHTNPYYAIFLSDGDSIGDWLSLRSDIRRGPLTEGFHKEFSMRLSEYAKDVSKLWKDKYPRLMVYAGGDDLMALMHPFDAVGYASRCAKKFEEKLRDLAKEGKKPSISGGILITHAKMSLQKALIEVRELEKRAKNVEGKGALCVGVMTRTGNLTSFVAKWEHLNLFRRFVWLFCKRKIGSGVAYDLRFILNKFGEDEVSFNENIFLSLVRRSIRRRVNDDSLSKKLVNLVEEFYKNSKEYTDDKGSLFAAKNLVNLIYVARFLGTLREVDTDAFV